VRVRRVLAGSAPLPRPPAQRFHCAAVMLRWSLAGVCSSSHGCSFSLLPVCLFVCVLFVYLFVCLFVCLFVWLGAYAPICLFVSCPLSLQLELGAGVARVRVGCVPANPPLHSA
jgi:hypothetical protein